MSENVKELRDDLKRHLADHDGELVYWGETVDVSSFVTTTSPLAGEVGRAARPGEGKALELEKLRTETIGDCHLCPLGDTRIKLAFGVGNPEARVLFIGEGPGYDEDRQGVPFVGKAGQLLDKILAAIDLDRTKVYIANVVKCHPMVDPSKPDQRGNDRPPTPEEMDQCLPFLRRQIEIIRPEIIVTLGATAMKGLLGNIGGIMALRGRLQNLRMEDGSTIPVLPTFHPAALLRNPDWKKPVWEDMKKLRDMLKDQ